MDSPSTPPPHRPSSPIQDTLPLPASIAATKSPSPSASPLRKSKTRLSDLLEVAADESPEPAALRRRYDKTKPPQMASPRNVRKLRSKRSEIEIREDKDVAILDEVGKQRKRRNRGRPKKEKPNLAQPSTSFPKNEEENGVDLERFGKLVSDLVMWKDASKSTLWFGLGSFCLLPTFFSQGLNFSIVSALSQLAIIILGVSFLTNSICQRNRVEEKCEVKLKEDDILRLAKLILPALNLAIFKARVLFSGEPSMTLKVVPFLLLGAEFGHFITIWRLCAIGYFASFSVPMLYSFYATQIDHKAECLKLWLLETWLACTHKKKVMASALLTFWNLSSVKTRVFTAFILLVLFRCLKQNVMQQFKDAETQVGEKEHVLQQLQDRKEAPVGGKEHVLQQLQDGKEAPVGGKEHVLQQLQEGKEAPVGGKEQQALVVVETEEKEMVKEQLVVKEQLCQN